MTAESVADIQFSKRFSANLITNVISLILSTLVGLLLIPYFIDTLGEAAYGLVPLATSITTYVTLLVDSLNAATGRYLMFDLRLAKVDEARVTFNTALVTIVACVLILLPVVLIVAVFSPHIFNIGEVAANDVVILFALVFVSALLNMIKANFTLSLTSYNRLDLKNYVAIFQTILQIGLIVLFFTLSTPSLPYIGLAYFTAALASLLFATVLSRIFCKELTMGVRYVSKDRFKTLLSMTVWTLVKYSGVILRSNIGLVIANIVCGVIVGAEYAIIVMWQTLLVAIMGSLTSIFYPNVYTYCAKHDDKGLLSFLSLATRSTAVISGLIIGLLTVYSSELLTLWVGEEFAHLGFLAILLVFPILFRSSADNLNYVMIAKLKFRQNAVIYLLAGILTAVFSAIGAYFFGMPGLIISGGLVMILVESWGIFVYTAYLMKQRVSSMLFYLVPGLLMLVITVVIGAVVKVMCSGETIVSLVVGGGIIGVLALLICSRLILSGGDWKNIRACMPGLKR
ncbi:MAG: lipopolysaccharide biosynthesis protein [Methanocorpusculum sp.]|nr:lipopolysaccharide biosynthesis protein [Methanocorpusculum sp.]MBQ4597479.1 lipopolysaccharide biosynthesis protein [Methanocorpusculum sp.]